MRYLNDYHGKPILEDSVVKYDGLLYVVKFDYAEFRYALYNAKGEIEHYLTRDIARETEVVSDDEGKYGKLALITEYPEINELVVWDKTGQVYKGKDFYKVKSFLTNNNKKLEIFIT